MQSYCGDFVNKVNEHNITPVFSRLIIRPRLVTFLGGKRLEEKKLNFSFW